MDKDRALVPFDELHSLTSPTEFGLTERQATQIDRIATSYLKSYRLKGSYQNLTQAMPIIRGCIADAMKQVKGHEHIEPSDDINSLFNKGFGPRKDLLTDAAHAYTRVSNADVPGSELALPTDIINYAGQELDNAVFAQNLTNCRVLVHEVNRRVPVFDNLLNIAMGEVEKILPGSKDQQLARGEQAGLVRNFLFSWVVFGKVQPLIETSDIIAQSKLYHDIIEENPELWSQFCTEFNIDQILGHEYITQLGRQIGNLLRNIPIVEDPSPEVTDTIYTRLKKAFLLNKPFHHLAELSMDPNDIGRSVWDKERSQLLNVDDQLYRIVLPETLRLMAFKVKDADRDSSYRLFRLANSVQEFIDSNQSGIGEQKTSDQEERVQNLIDGKNHFERGLLLGDYSDEAIFGQEELEELYNEQVAEFQRELQVYDLVDRFITEERLFAIDLLRKHQNGEPISLGELEAIGRVQYAPIFITHRVSGFRSRLVGRTFRIARSFESSAYRPEKDLFDQAIEATLFDLLSCRTDNWVNDFIDSSRLPKEFIERRDRELSYAFRDFNNMGEENRLISYFLTLPPEERTFAMNSHYLAFTGEQKRTESARKYSNERERRLTRKSYAGTTAILRSIARLTSLDLWRVQQVTLRDFLKNNATMLDDQNQETTSDRRRTSSVTRYKNLRRKFQSYLSSKGFDYDYVTLVDIAPAQTLHNMISDGDLFTSFFGSRIVIAEYHDFLTNKMQAQLSEQPKFLKARPSTIVANYDFMISNAEAKLKHLGKETEEKHILRLQYLQNMGVLKHEDIINHAVDNVED